MFTHKGEETRKKERHHPRLIICKDGHSWRESREFVIRLLDCWMNCHFYYFPLLSAASAAEEIFSRVVRPALSHQFGVHHLSKL